MRWLCAACVVFASASARADDATVAQQLYDKAKQLEADGKLREACTAFAASFKADPQLGVLLNLADCHEKIGKLASAWSEFREAVNRANRISDAREAYARKRADALAPRLAKLHVVPPAAGTTVTLDGADVTALVGTDMPIDSGAHELTASAPGRAKQTKHVTIADTAATTTVEIAPDKAEGVDRRRVEERTREPLGAAGHRSKRRRRPRSQAVRATVRTRKRRAGG